MSDDVAVIELGSSDEEVQPAPKKQKPTPNAMVHIPHELPGITIRRAKSGPSKTQILPKKALVRKTPKTINPLAANVKVNDIRPKNQSSSNLSERLIKKAIVAKKLPQGHSIQGGLIKPFVPIKISNTAAVKRVVVPVGNQIVNPPLKPNSFCSQPLHVKQKLPPSVTIKRLMPQAKRIKLQRPKSAEVLTVESDDDEDAQEKGSTSATWFLKPEEDVKSSAQETKNNSEPASSKTIEITIADSPVKPKNKETGEIGTEYPITIEDSPVAPKHKKQEQKQSTSEDENDDKQNNKEKHSKKKLNYPNTCTSKGLVEVEIEPFTSQPSADNENCKTETEKKDIMETIEIEESPLKLINEVEENTPKKVEVHVDVPEKQTVTMKKFTEEEKVPVKSDSIEVEEVKTSEFHPTYQSFIDMCFKLENSEDMKIIVEKKIKAYYLQVPKEYVESEEFLDMVSGKIISMKASPEKMYLYIKDVVDELNLQRKMARNKVVPKDEKNIEVENFLYGEESQFDSKRKRQIKKLEKTLKKIHRGIQKLEQQEVDFDDEEDSVYLLTERYKERMVKVHSKLCQLTNTKMPSEPRIHIDARPGRPQGPAKRLEKWINRKVPIGTPFPFPDFHDVLRCVKDANEQDNLGWNDVDIMEEARDLFTSCGKKLQRRRQENEWRLAVSRIPADVDPAEESEELKRKLNENRQMATKKETEVFNKFADKQKQLKLEAVEIGDKEAEESPADSDDEEANDECEALEDKEKRKDRIKRLLQEKNKKTADERGESTSEKMETDDIIKAIDGSEKMTTDETPTDKADTVDSELKRKSDDSKENKNDDNDDVINSLSDSSKIDSDIDELHLLQKLHSGNEVNYSSDESSNSESPIDISDSLDSDDGYNLESNEVISIENSSYSESETVQEVEKDSIENKSRKNDTNIETNDTQEKPMVNTDIDESNDNEVKIKELDSKIVPLQTMEIEYTPLGNARKIITNDDNDLLAAEEILLASSEENSESNSPINECMNVNDDALSIGETCVEVQDNNVEKLSPKNDNISNINDDNSLDVAIVSESENRDKDEVSEGSIKQVEPATVVDCENTYNESENLGVNNRDQNLSDASKDPISEKCVVSEEDTLNVDITKGQVENEKALKTHINEVDDNVDDKNNDISNNGSNESVESLKKSEQSLDDPKLETSQNNSIVEVVST